MSHGVVRGYENAHSYIHGFIWPGGSIRITEAIPLSANIASCPAIEALLNLGTRFGDEETRILG